MFPDYDSFSDQEKLELKENVVHLHKREERVKTNEETKVTEFLVTAPELVCSISFATSLSKTFSTISAIFSPIYIF